MTTNTFSLTIETDNEAFQEFNLGAREVARILREVADSITQKYGGTGSYGAAPLILRDANGNTVGEAGFGR